MFSSFYFFCFFQPSCPNHLNRPGTSLNISTKALVSLATILTQLAIFFASLFFPAPSLAQELARPIEGTFSFLVNPNAAQNTSQGSLGQDPGKNPPNGQWPGLIATIAAARKGTSDFLDGVAKVSRPPHRPKALFGKSCSLSLYAVGDILIHDTTRSYSLQPDGSYDFKPNFAYARPILSQGDLVIGNLENPLAGKELRFSGYPNFNAPQELAVDLKDSGFTTVTVANNHSLDRGWAGLETTLKTVRAAGLDYVGAYLDPDDKKRQQIYIYNGLKVGILAYTYGLNGRSGPKKGEEWRLGVIDRETIWNDLKAVREEGVDFLIVILHFGEEYQRKPNQAQTSLVSELLVGDPQGGLDGPDLILGHHPHVVQPFVQVLAAQGSTSQAVMYSLGNFMTSQNYPYTNLGLILEGKLSISFDGRKIMGPFSLIPTYCHKGTKDGKRYYKVIPLAQAARDPKSYGLTDSHHKQLAAYLEEMNRHLVSMEPDPDKRPFLK